jgi:hypothetical protein
VYFGMSVSAGYLTATVTMAAVAREVGVDALVKMAKMTVSQMSIQNTTPSPQQRQHWLSELRESYRARRCFYPAPVSERLQLVRCIHARRGTGLRPRMRNRLEYRHGEFLFIYRESTVSRAQPSPEEMQALGTAWYAWMQKFSSAIVPGGDGLKHTGRLVKAGLVTDGPYVEAKEIIVSFTIIQADNYDAAVAIARACPPGHTIEIRELAGYA